jgi:hypothetical protein
VGGNRLERRTDRLQKEDRDPGRRSGGDPGGGRGGLRARDWRLPQLFDELHHVHASFPSGGGFNTPGNVLITDQFNNRVIEVNPHTNQVVWQYDQGLETAADASRLPNNDTLIADAAHSRVVEVSPQGSVVWQYFTNQSQESNATPFPSNAVRLANGDTSIADTLNNRIVVVNTAGQIVWQYGMTNVAGDGANQLNWPYSGYVIGDYTGMTTPPGAIPTGGP